MILAILCHVYPSTYLYCIMRLILLSVTVLIYSIISFSKSAASFNLLANSSMLLSEGFPVLSEPIRFLISLISCLRSISCPSFSFVNSSLSFPFYTASTKLWKICSTYTYKCYTFLRRLVISGSLLWSVTATYFLFNIQF